MLLKRVGDNVGSPMAVEPYDCDSDNNTESMVLML